MAAGAETGVAVKLFVGVLVLALLMITAGLFMLNVEGAWIASGGNLPYTVVIGGVELLAAVALTLAVRRVGLQRYVGIAIFGAAVWICIQNGKFSIHHHFATMFPDRPDVLESKASLMDEQADLIKENPEAARSGLQMQLDRKIGDKAKAEAEVNLMTDPSRIREAQERLQALGLYEGKIDGIKDTLTEDATRKRGVDLNRQLVQLEGEIRATELLVQSSASEGGILSLKMEAANLRGQAKTAREGTTWMNRLLWGTESARSFGFWAYFTGALAAVITGEAPARKLFKLPALKLPKVRLPKLRLRFWEKAGDADEEPPAPPAPVPPANPKSDLTKKQLDGAKGPEAKDHYNDADDKLKLPIPPVATVDAEGEPA